MALDMAGLLEAVSSDILEFVSLLVCEWESAALGEESAVEGDCCDAVESGFMGGEEGGHVLSVFHWYVRGIEKRWWVKGAKSGVAQEEVYPRKYQARVSRAWE